MQTSAFSSSPFKKRMNSSSCGGNMYNTSLIVDSATNGASIPVCMVAAIMVFAYKLHRKTVYRLALYQVLTAAAMAVIHVIQVVIIDYCEDVCKAFAYLTLFVEWAKLLLSTWVTLHLFVFAVFHKNLRRCEAVYVVTSLAIPALIASLPFATSSYGLAGSWCWIKSRTYVSNGSACYEERVLVGTIEQFALWYGPSLLLLFISSVAMVLMMIVLGQRMCGGQLDTGKRHCRYKDQHWKAFKQLLPLAAYPIVYFIFTIPPFVYRVYRACVLNRSIVHDGLELTAAISTSAWCLAAGLTLIVHIIMTRSFLFGRKHTYVMIKENLSN